MLRIKELCKENSIGITELGSKFGVDKASMNRFVNEVRPMKADLAYEISKYFDVSLDYLVGHSDIRNEKVIKDAIHNALIKNGYTGKAGEEEEIVAILEKTLEIHRMKKGL